MCGIAGYKSRGRVCRTTLEAMARSIAHRGPDGEGFCYSDDGTLGLAHRRLAVIDPGHGTQPMQSRGGEAAVTFNGTIYNYLELRRELIGRGHPIASYSDTEVLLYAYLEWGERCLERFNGMFAFVIHDRRNRTLFGARDRFGEKPLYYRHDGESFVFASEAKAILASGCVRPEAETDSLREYVTFQYCPAERSMFKNIMKLKPAHCFVLDERSMKLKVREYWDLDYGRGGETREEAYYVDRLRALVDDAVALRLRADVPVGSTLSGGIDSSAVAAVASLKIGGDFPFETFTGRFAEGPEYDETVYAKAVAGQIAGRYNEITVGAETFVRDMEKIVYHMDEPQGGPGVFPQYRVAAAAGRKVKVLLSGQGGDELFLGYTRYLVAYYEKMLRRTIRNGSGYYREILNAMTPNLGQLRGYEPMMRDFFAGGLFDGDARSYFRLVDRTAANRGLFVPGMAGGEALFARFEAVFSRHDASIVDKMSYYDLKTFLPSLLHVEDRVSMAHGVESRAPFLDHRIAEFLAGVPAHIRFRDGLTKYLPKRVFRNIVPDAVLDRTDKKGFPTPANLWFRTVLREWVNDLLSDRRTLERGLYDRRRLAELVDGSGTFGRSLWGVISLELWFRRFVDR